MRHVGKKPKIVVAGDVTVDWFMYPVDTSDEGENWRQHTSSHADALRGGAALLTKFTKQSLEAEGTYLDLHCNDCQTSGKQNKRKA